VSGARLAPGLTVGVLNWHSAPYVRFLERTMRARAANPGFRLLVCNTGGDVSGLAKLPYAATFETDVEPLRGSIAHGTALNALAERFETEYAVIVDVDCAVLAKDWDQICIAELDGDCLAIGAPYDRRAAHMRYQDFPALFFFFFKVAPFRAMGIDLRPDNHTVWDRTRFRVGRALGLSPESRDTGWRLPREFRRHGYTGKAFDYRHGGDRDAVVVGPDVGGDEFHWRGRPILTHQGRSGQRPFWEHPHSRAWVQSVCRYLDWDPEETVNDMIGGPA
jgi:hypothetical protein